MIWTLFLKKSERKHTIYFIGSVLTHRMPHKVYNKQISAYGFKDFIRSENGKIRRKKSRSINMSDKLTYPNCSNSFLDRLEDVSFQRGALRNQ